MVDSELADGKRFDAAAAKLELVDGEFADGEGTDGDRPKGDGADSNGPRGCDTGGGTGFDDGSCAGTESHGGILVRGAAHGRERRDSLEE